MLEGLEFVRVASNKDINVQLSLKQREAFRVSPRHDLVAVAQADLKLANGDSFLLRIRGILVEITSSDMHIAG